MGSAGFRKGLKEPLDRDSPADPTGTWANLKWDCGAGGVSCTWLGWRAPQKASPPAPLLRKALGVSCSPAQTFWADFRAAGFCFCHQLVLPALQRLENECHVFSHGCCSCLL